MTWWPRRSSWRTYRRVRGGALALFEVLLAQVGEGLSGLDERMTAMESTAIAARLCPGEALVRVGRPAALAASTKAGFSQLLHYASLRSGGSPDTPPPRKPGELGNRLCPCPSPPQPPRQCAAPPPEWRPPPPLSGSTRRATCEHRLRPEN